MSYLFLVNIGPVQDFIASARRTRDLHFGSWFLSELARAAAHAIVSHNTLNCLIFPAPNNEELLFPNNPTFSVANKIIAKVQQPPDILGPLMRQAVFTRLHDIRDKAYKSVYFRDGMRSIADKQVEDLVECLWVSLPFYGQDYQDTRKQVEALMAARKNTRDFAQTTPWQAAVPKSSLDGKLESVIPEQAYPSALMPENDRRKKILLLYEDYGAGPAERLSGVDLLKRKGVTAFGTDFPSSSHMATLPFQERLKVFQRGTPPWKAVKQAWNAYIEKVELLSFTQKLERVSDRYYFHPIIAPYEGSMLFEDRLVDVLYEPGVIMSKASPLQDAKRALNDFYQVLDRQFDLFGYGHTRPNPYYALLQADGDGMGALIDAQAAYGEEKHRELSDRLSQFANKATEIVKDHRGALVYAGGDDVLAFLPLDTLLECAQKLKDTFGSILKGFTPSPSLSVGVAIAHHLDSLRRVRYLAQEAEQRAKDVKGKNALAITVSKRSGEDYRVAGQWGELDANLRKLIDFYRKEAIPVGTAYELRELALRLSIPTHGSHTASHEKETIKQLIDVLQKDTQRILKRKLSVPAGKFSPEQIGTVESFFGERISMQQDPQADENQVPSFPLDEFVNELIIAQVLSDAKELAMPKKKGSHL